MPSGKSYPAIIGQTRYKRIRVTLGANIECSLGSIGLWWSRIASLYMGGQMIDWQAFLGRWSRELMGTELSKQVVPPLERAEWLGFDPASEAGIAEVEERLGVLLPPSYKAFLLTSNGWRRTTFAIGRIRPIEEVNWFRVENEQWAEIYGEDGSTLEDVEYYNYRDGEGAPDHRAEHMRSLLQISDVDDGVYLLNPEAVTPDGEWEAWFFANWIPGAASYASFAHLMVQEYRSFAKVQKVKGGGGELPRLATPAPNVPRVPAERIRKKMAKAPTLESLIEQMGAVDDKVRAKAVRMFFGKHTGRPRAKRRPDLVPALTDLFYASADADVRCACVAGLTAMAEEGEAPKPLFDALSDCDPGVVVTGISALHYFPDARAWKPICRFVESRGAFHDAGALTALGEIGDERAVPTLTRVLVGSAPNLMQKPAEAACALARCGPNGFDVLVDALTHEDPRVRFAAVVGVDVSGDPRGAAYLDRMEADADARVRQRAKVRMGGWL